nr:aldo/keto reductase [Novosphingobium flavum]
MEVSIVGIGCNNFGRELDLAATCAIVDAAVDAGITFFDTADRYGDPKTQSETFLGEALRPHRDKVVLATKFGRWLDAERGGASARYVRSATEACLKRLQTDRIDLMQLHIPDPDTPIEETLGALQDLIKEGKIREIGSSNFTLEDIRGAAAASAGGKLPRFITTQLEYSLLHHREVAGLIAECERENVLVLPFRPLFHGLLTGKYRPGEPAPAGSRIGSKNADYQARILTPENLATVSALISFAEARGHTVLELAFAWLLAHPFVPSIIAGVSSPRQVVSNVAAAQWELTPAEKAEVDGLLAVTA